MAKWDNMLSVLWMLRYGRKLTAAQIADSLEISVRTVYRYIDALCASGVPIVSESGHDGGIHILESFKGTPLFFDSVELKALVDASKFAEGAGYPYTQELKIALNKVEVGLQEEQRHHLYRHTSGLYVIAPARSSFTIPLLRDLEKAVQEGQVVRINYRKANAEHADEREVNPYGLVYNRNNWYAIGHCQRSNAMRMFRVDRIERLEITEFHFEKPELFSASEYFRDESKVGLEADGPLTVICIEGEPDILNTICGHWHLRHYLTMKSDREITFLLDVKTMNKYLPNYLIAFGTAICIREPLELKLQLKEMAYGIAKHYEEIKIEPEFRSNDVTENRIISK